MSGTTSVEIEPGEFIPAPDSSSEPATEEPFVKARSTAQGGIAASCQKLKSSTQLLAQAADEGSNTVACYDPIASSLGATPTQDELQRRALGPDSTAAASAMAADSRLPIRCTTDKKVDTWYYGRDFYCLIKPNVVINTLEVPSGRIIGTAVWTITHATGLSPRTGTFWNYAAFYLVSASGEAPTTVSSFNTCQGNCYTQSGYPFTGWQTVSPGGRASGFNNLSSNPPTNVVYNGLQTSSSDGFKSARSTPGYLTYQSPIKFRCDAQTGVGAAQGCVVPSITPQLVLAGRSGGNTSAGMILWFQYNNIDHWGQYPNGKPLTRLASDAQGNANRRALCENGVWKKDSRVYDDSCDEFPFAKTYQSGNMLGQTASQCSQVFMTYANGRWTGHVYPGYSTSQRCVLGHITLNSNSSVGGSYGAFVQNSRVLNGDPFWIGVF